MVDQKFLDSINMFICSRYDEGTYTLNPNYNEPWECKYFYEDKCHIRCESNDCIDVMDCDAIKIKLVPKQG